MLCYNAEGTMTPGMDPASSNRLVWGLGFNLNAESEPMELDNFKVDHSFSVV
jgi:hypothetical protein